MLSGGLDSSIITAITKQYVQPLTTYSITYEDQEKYFKAYDYQTSMDDDYIREMVERYQSDHHKITLKQLDLLNSLEEALIARDMPGMADVDSSFLLFSKEIAKNHKSLSQVNVLMKSLEDILGSIKKNCIINHTSLG